MSMATAIFKEEAIKALEELEASGTARLPKLEILERNKSNDVLKEMFLYTYNWQWTWGISCPKINVNEGPAVSWSWDSFKLLLDNLKDRQLTGSSAREGVEAYLLDNPPRIRKWLVRILQRDLQIRVSTGTIDKVWPKLVPKFDLQLAETYEEGVTKLKFPVYTEPKLDGLRLLVFCRQGKGVALSRGAKQYESVQFIADALAAADPTTSYVIDGEAYADSGWNEAISLVKTHPDNMSEDHKARLKTNLLFYAFDVTRVSVDGSIAHSTLPYKDRRNLVKKVVETASTTCPNIRWIVGEEANSYEEMAEAYDGFLSMGFEGIMIKDPNAPYTLARSNGWLKYKPEVTIEAEILSAHEGTSPNTTGKLGQFEVMTADKTQFFVGGGFTFEQRELFWRDRDKVVGNIIEVKTQKDAGQNVSKARFPVFKRMRVDRPKFEFTSYWQHQEGAKHSGDAS